MRYPNSGPEARPPSRPIGSRLSCSPPIRGDQFSPHRAPHWHRTAPSVSQWCEIVPLLTGFSDILVNWSEFWPAVSVSMPRIMISNRCKYIVRRLLHLIVWMLAANSPALLNTTASVHRLALDLPQHFAPSSFYCIPPTSGWFRIGWDSSKSFWSRNFRNTK